MNFEKLYINGQWIDSHSDEYIEVENPATLQHFARVPAANAEDVQNAVRAAKEAWPLWKRTDLSERIAICEKMADILQTFREEIIDLEVAELGAPKEFAAKTHFDFQMERIRTFIRLAPQVPLREILDCSTQYREPIGVVAAITPWNYPLGQVVQKVMPALLMGNAVVVKPSQHTPLTVFYLVDAFERAGLPAGVLNLVTGRGSEVGNVLATHPDVDMVSFTGSTSGGIDVGRQGLLSVKRIHLELGGKSPCVILPGADVDSAIRACFNSCFLNSGQTCSALSRLLIPETMTDEVHEAMLRILPEYTVGDPKTDVRIGPLANRKQFDKVKEYIEIGLQEGATMLAGEVPTQVTCGYYVSPVIFVDVTPEMRIAQEEVFGPVLTVLTYRDEEDAIRLANQTLYGLSGAVHGPQAKANEVARQILAGNVYVNAAARDVTAPFGGYKQSGIGREGGLEGLREFTQIKVVFDGGLP